MTGTPKTLKVLAVDDERLNLDLLDLFFEHTEFELLRAEDGVEALQKLSEIGSCDVILLDWMMPNMNGLELLKILKADRRYAHIPVIMQSAMRGPEIRESMREGAYHYVLKPYDAEEILGVVRAALMKEASKAKFMMRGAYTASLKTFSWG